MAENPSTPDKAMRAKRMEWNKMLLVRQQPLLHRDRQAGIGQDPTDSTMPDSILGGPTDASRESASATTLWLMSEINSLMNKSCRCWQTDQGSKTLERKGTGNAGLQKKNYQELT
jgi:hypothetical protein